jgi:hypothetical protein
MPGASGIERAWRSLRRALASIWRIRSLGLSGKGKRPANLLQRVLRAVLQTIAHLPDLLLARGRGVQHVPKSAAMKTGETWTGRVLIVKNYFGCNI